MFYSVFCLAFCLSFFFFHLSYFLISLPLFSCFDSNLFLLFFPPQSSRDIERKQAKLATLTAQISSAKEPHKEILDLQQQKASFVSRLTKNTELTESLEKNEQSWSKDLERKTAALREKRETLRLLKAEKSFLEDQVSNQKITPQELSKMNSQRETMEQNRAALQTQTTELRSQVASLESQVDERTASLKALLKQYALRIQALGLDETLPLPGEIGHEIQHLTRAEDEESEEGRRGDELTDVHGASVSSSKASRKRKGQRMATMALEIIPFTTREGVESSASGFESTTDAKNVLSLDIYNDIIPRLSHYRSKVRERAWKLESKVSEAQDERRNLENIEIEKAEKLSLTQARYVGDSSCFVHKICQTW